MVGIPRFIQAKESLRHGMDPQRERGMHTRFYLGQLLPVPRYSLGSAI
jgi:hypothetical protein